MAQHTINPAGRPSRVGQLFLMSLRFAMASFAKRTKATTPDTTIATSGPCMAYQMKAMVAANRRISHMRAARANRGRVLFLAHPPPHTWPKNRSSRAFLLTCQNW